MPRQTTPRRSAGPAPRKTGPAPRKKRHKTKPSSPILPRLLLFAFFCALFAAAAVTASFFAPHHPHPVHPSPSSLTETPPAAVLVSGLPNPQAPITAIKLRRDGVPMILVAGGVAGTRRGLHRQMVSDFVRDCGAAAGLNGTFFANASLDGTDNLLIGPSLCGDESQVVRGPFDRRAALAGRPLVLISPERTRILAYNPKTMDDGDDIHRLLPGVTDVFLGGVWLVHGGVAADAARMARFDVGDANDPRIRAFFGLMPDGRPVLGATTWVTSSLKLSRALQDAGVREAVLLDSGFSTSLVWNGKILVTGHTSPGLPSRPVPHALVLFGKPELANSKIKSLAATT